MTHDAEALDESLGVTAVRIFKFSGLARIRAARAGVVVEVAEETVTIGVAESNVALQSVIRANNIVLDAQLHEKIQRTMRLQKAESGL